MIPSRTADFINHGAPKGSRNEELFNAVCQLRDMNMSAQQAHAMIEPAALQSGLRPHELAATISSVFSRGARESATSHGYKPLQLPTGKRQRMPRPQETPIKSLMAAAFSEGERVRLCKANNSDGRPNGSGELWEVTELPTAELDLNDEGTFIAINPLDGGIKDIDVTSYRHCLVEFDDEPIPQQWALIEESKLPVTAVIYSAGKSLHAWVRVDAATREEYDERVNLVYDYFSNYNLDTKNKNPSRLSRLPGASRKGVTQDLLAVRIGLPAWDDWIEHMESISAGPTIKLSQLRSYLDHGDKTSLLGNRWLCEGGSCVLSGPSGIGKSSISMQMAMLWGVGREAFGVKPARPLKSLIIQAENDKGDLAEQVLGVEAGLGLEDEATLEDNITILHCTSFAGAGFVALLEKLVEKHKPDICWIDPLFSYIGGDVCSQEVCSKFLREGLNPISARTGVVWMIIHHTTKPKESEYKGSWQSYDMYGSSELVNWARAVCVLKPRAGNYVLTFAKRGKRAGDREEVMLRHADDGICWETIEDDTIYCE